MCGIRTNDGIAFVADSVFPRQTIDKYHIFFVYDVGGFLNTLDFLETMQAELFVPSHAEAVEDIKSLVAINRKKVMEVMETIHDFCTEPINFEEILKKAFDSYHLDLNLNQYVLVGSTIRSYLSFLCDSGSMEIAFQDNRLLFHAL